MYVAINENMSKAHHDHTPRDRLCKLRVNYGLKFLRVLEVKNGCKDSENLFEKRTQHTMITYLIINWKELAIDTPQIPIFKYTTRYIYRIK